MEIPLILLCAVAFAAGFVDAVAGGGGLIQIPLSLSLLPHAPMASILGSLKIPSFSGTALASVQYLRKAKIAWKYFLCLAILSFSSAFLGSYTLTLVNSQVFKPVLFGILLFLWVFTYLKKDFFQQGEKHISLHKKWIWGLLLAFVVGFYDGFIGPATGTFFIMGFVWFVGMGFYEASAYAKLINLATNFGGICLFLFKGQIIWHIALPMAFFNALGGYLGAKMTILKGVAWVRYLFLLVMLLAIIRFGSEIF